LPSAKIEEFYASSLRLARFARALQPCEAAFRSKAAKLAKGGAAEPHAPSVRASRSFAARAGEVYSSRR